MISKISGKIEQLQDDTVSVSIDTGVTYEMYIGVYAIPEIQKKMDGNEFLEFHTYHYLEGNVTSSQMIPRLIGFLSKEERDFFIRFIKVPGISPRSGIKALVISWLVCLLTRSLISDEYALLIISRRSPPFILSLDRG